MEPTAQKTRRDSCPGRSAAIAVFYRSGEDEMEIRMTLYVTSREEWRAWLTKHYQSEIEVWLEEAYASGGSKASSRGSTTKSSREVYSSSRLHQVVGTEQTKVAQAD